ncbi:MAG: hypothetical protein V7K20_08870 [Nostoc sp.]
MQILYLSTLILLRLPPCDRLRADEFASRQADIPHLFSEIFGITSFGNNNRFLLLANLFPIL